MALELVTVVAGISGWIRGSVISHSCRVRGGVSGVVISHSCSLRGD